MKINFIDSRTSPQSFMVFADFPIETIRQTKEVYVIASLETKTRVNSSLAIEGYRCGLNNPVEGFKTHEKTEHSYFTGRYTTKHYFVKSKKQGLDEYKAYISKILTEHLGKYGIDELTVYLRVGNTFV